MGACAEAVGGVDEAYMVPHDDEEDDNENDNEDPQHAANNIPVIDLGPLHAAAHPDPDPLAIAHIVAQINHACRSWGFFQVVNHGVPAHLLSSCRQEALAFFQLPLASKKLVARSASNSMGYADFELTKNVRDWKEVFDFTLAGNMQLPVSFQDGVHETETHANVWPQQPRRFRDACESYAAAAQAFAFELLELISQSLDLPPRRFHAFFQAPNTTRMRLNHYAVCPCPELVLGVGPHKDSGGITILAQDDVGGLEVKTKDGKWMKVLPDPAALVVNVGGLFQVWSNDIFLSVEHRVAVNSERERLSIPLFFNPGSTVDVAPLPELLDAQHPPLYRPINWGKFYKRRRDSNFKNLGVANLQIYDYAINR